MRFIYRVYYFKNNQTTIMHYGTKMKSEVGPLPYYKHF
jgi:hypothetical protein